MKKTLWIIALALTSFACSEGNGPGDNNYDQTELLTNLADQIVVPAYNDAVESAEELTRAATLFADAPASGLLSDLRSAFVDMYRSWQDISLFEFGPADNASLRANVNTYPANTANILGLIAAGTWNLDAIANIDSKGLPALDYLLYGRFATDPELLEAFTTGGDADVYQRFLVDLAEDIENRINAVRDSWTGGYATSFKTNTGSSIGSALGMYVNAYIFHYERPFRTLKLGLPAGVFSLEGDIYPEEAEAYYSGISSELIRRNFEQIERVFRGTGYLTAADGTGLDDYLSVVGADALRTAIGEQLDVIDNALNDLLTPLTAQLADDRPGVIAVYTEVQRVVATLKADLASALSIQITYSDNDGD